MDIRSQQLLKIIINQHIADGNPVGSKKLSDSSGLELSPASIRNIMKNLEDEGFIASPHTSAGRVPTKKGYRFFVDTLIAFKEPTKSQLDIIEQQIKTQANINSSVSETLSKLTHHAGLIIAPKSKKSTFQHIEFISLGKDKILAILVTHDQKIVNKILPVTENFTTAELIEFSNYLTKNYQGLTLEETQEKLNSEIQETRRKMIELMKTAIENSNSDEENIFISGKENLIEDAELSKDLNGLKKIMAIFDKKQALLRLLEKSQHTNGVQIFIGEESGYQALDECSVITSPYKIDGEIIGTLGVIGPTRMAYERIIPIVDITAKLLSNINLK